MTGANMARITRILIIQTYRSDVNMKLESISLGEGK